MAAVPLYVEGIFGIVVGRGADSFAPSFYFVASEIDSYFKVLHIFSYKYLTPFLAFKFHDRANPLIRYDYDLQQTIDWERTHQIMLPLCPSSPHQIYYLGLYSNSEQFYLRCYWQVGQKTQSTTVPPWWCYWGSQILFTSFSSNLSPLKTLKQSTILGLQFCYRARRGRIRGVDWVCWGYWEGNKPWIPCSYLSFWFYFLVIC